MPLLVAVGATALVSLLLGTALWLAGLLAPQLDGELSVAGALQVAIYGGASLWLVRDAGPGQALFHALGLRGASLGMAVGSIALGVALHGPAGLLEWLGRWAFPIDPGLLHERMLRLAPTGGAERMMIALLVVVFGPLVEELFFRGAMQTRLGLSARSRAVVLTTTFCFTISHPEPRLWPALALVGLVLGSVRVLARGIFGCFLLHASFNATTLAVAFQDRAKIDALEPPRPSGVLLGSLIAGAILWWMVQPSLARPEGRG